MEQSNSLIVTDKDGLRGTIRTDNGEPTAGESQVRVVLENGQQALVPASALIREADGRYHLPVSLAEFVGAAHAATPTATTHAQTGGSVVVPVVEERLSVSRQAVETGKVRVAKIVREREEVVDEPLLREEVHVERVPIDRYVDGPVPIRQEGEITIIPVLEEVLVVEKRLMLKEELHITRRQIETHAPQRVTLRSEEATVQRVSSHDRPEGERSAV